MSYLECKHVFYKPEHNAKGEPHGIKFQSSWNVKIKYNNRYSSKSGWEKWGHFYHIFSQSYSVWSLKCQIWFIFSTFNWWQQNIVKVWAKYLSALLNSFWDFLENGRVNRSCWSYLSCIDGKNIKKLMSQQYRNPVFSMADILHVVTQYNPWLFSERAE